MKIKQLRDLTSEELKLKVKDFKKNLFELNHQRRVGNLEKPALFQLYKKDIARILTIIEERESDERKSNSTK